MKRHILILAALLALLSCGKSEDFSGYSSLSGRWYPEYSDVLVDKFIEFKGGNLDTYVSDEKYPGVDGLLWNCTENDFKKLFSSRYSIRDGQLTSGPDNFGKILISDGKLVVNGDLYSRLEGFNSAHYSEIVLEGVGEVLELPGEPSSHEFDYSVRKPIPGYPEVEISYDCDWIYNCFTADGKVRFSVSEFSGTSSSQNSRTGTISISYRYAETVRIAVTQKSLY